MGDLVTLSRVRNYVKPQGSEDDDVLAQLISYASRMIRVATGRTLTTPAEVEARGLRVSGARSILLDDRLTDVVSIEAPYPLERTLAEDEFELRQHLTGTELVLDVACEGNLLVAGSWGWDALPAEIEYAAIVTVDEWYRRNVLPGITGSEGEAEGRTINLAAEVQEILQPWKMAGAIA